MHLVKSLSKSKVAKVLTLALILAGVISGVNFSHASDTAHLTVKVFEGSTGSGVLVSGARVNLSNGQTMLTDGLGVAVFRDIPVGIYRVEIRTNNYYDRNYDNVNVDMDTELDADIVRMDANPSPSPAGPDGCTPAPPMGAPMLNIWPISSNGAKCTDYPLLMAKNLTRGSGYINGGTVAANSGDIIRVQLYVHNGVLDYPENEAKNVVLKANMNGNEMSGEAWADNANRVNSGQKGGDIRIGSSNFTLSYIPGSAVLYDRNYENPRGFSDSVVTSGASVGNMRGCFPFLHFVTLDVRVNGPVVTPPIPQPNPQPQPQPQPQPIPQPTPEPTPIYTFYKTVRNVTKDDTGTLVKSVHAAPGDVVQFGIFVGIDQGNVYDMWINDQLPAGLNFVPGSLVVLDQNNKYTGLTDPISHITTGTLSVNMRRLYLFRATVVNIGQQTLVNNATITSRDDQKHDSALVIVDLPPAAGRINITKQVRDVSQNQSVFSPSTSANPGDQVEFQMKVTAANGNVNNVIFSDQLPSLLTYVNNSLTVDGTASGNNLGAVSLGNMTSGQTKTVVIRATVAGATAFTTGSTTMTNTARVTSDSNSDSATASVVVTLANTNVHLNINKQVRNMTQNQSGFVKSTSANPGDLVQFQIQVSADGNTTANNVTLVDTLPSNLNLVSGSLNSNLGNMNSGSTQTVTLTASVASESNFACGSTTLTNSATASASNTNSVSDTAAVTVNRNNNCGGGGGSVSLGLTKEVRNVTQNTGFSSNVNAANGDRVEFRIVARAFSGTANNVRVTDVLPTGLTYIPGTFVVDSGSNSGNLFGGNYQFLGNISSGSSRTLSFQATVNSSISQTLVNTATAISDNTNSVNASASVTVAGNANLVLSKSAYNQTRNVDATTVAAQPGDVIVYTLRVQNQGNAVANNFVFQDDLTDVLMHSNLKDFGNAAFNSGILTLTWPAENIPANTTVEKTFSVLVNNATPAGSDYIMTNVFGNTVNVRVAKVSGAFIAPPTGAGTALIFGLAFASVIGFWVSRKQNFASLIKLLTLNKNV